MKQPGSPAGRSPFHTSPCVIADHRLATATNNATPAMKASADMGIRTQDFVAGSPEPVTSGSSFFNNGINTAIVPPPTSHLPCAPTVHSA